MENEETMPDSDLDNPELKKILKENLQIPEIEEENRQNQIGTPTEETDFAALAQAGPYDLVRALYKNDYGQPFEMTPGQVEIFSALFFKQGPNGENRIHIKTYTQFGKSDVTGMAVLTRAATFPEKWAIVAPSQSKARIIMGYVIKHLFENEYTVSRFKVAEGENIDMVRRERSKNRLTFDIGNNQIGEIFILSAESRLKQNEDVGNSLMGFGSPNLVEDEAALISDESDAKAMRMVGGFTSAGMDFVVKIGNPFTRGHFLQAQIDPAYYKINIDAARGIKEGRLSQKFVDEMSQKPYFSVLYANEFPAADDIDSKGWAQMISEEEIKLAIVKEDEEIRHIGEKRLGNDVARGGNNYTTWVLRSMNYMELLAKSHMDNLTEVAGQTIFLAGQNKVSDNCIFIDDVGVGGGAVDPLRYQQKKVHGVNVGNKAMDDKMFANLRAEAYWRMREWIKKGGRLSRHDEWYELAKVKYKPDGKGRLRVMSKDDMRARGIDSPDIADGGMLTFVQKDHGDLEAMKRRRDEKKKKKIMGRGLRVTMGGYAWILILWMIQNYPI